MNILIAMDSFKGNLTSLGVADIVEAGIKKIMPEAKIEKAAVADGGEGTVDALLSAKGGRLVFLEVPDPQGRMIKASYAVLDDKTAVIETASASGLALLKKDERDPLKTSTYGTGLLIRDAVLTNNCRNIILAAGGSATNDGGAGIASALGIRFFSSEGTQIIPAGGDLDKVTDIDSKDKLDVNIAVITDVTNTLLGEFGASHVFGPQKGATGGIAQKLDMNLTAFSKLLFDKTGRDVKDIPGTGAAGGLGASLIALFGADIKKGVEYILDAISIEDKIKKADIVITGEGRMDRQTAFGKLPSGIAALAKKHHKTVYAIAGFLDEGYEKVYEHGIDAAFSSMVGPLDLDTAIKESPRLIEAAAMNLFRVISSSVKKKNDLLGGGGIHHTAMRVRDFELSHRFYTEVLGFKEVLAWGENDKRAAMLDTGDGSCLELFAGGSDEKKPDGIFLHLALNCSRIEPVIEDIREFGCRITVEPKTVVVSTPEPVSLHLAFFEGPDGEIIELFQRI